MFISLIDNENENICEVYVREKEKKKELKEMVKKEEKKRGRSVFYSHKKVNEIVILSHNEIMS